MVTLDKLRIDMEKQLAFDKDIHTVEVRADTLDECLDDAAVQLDSKKNNLEYEVIERGSQGMIGLMKKPWRIRVYENPTVIRQKKEKEAASLAGEQASASNAENERVDGMFYVHRFGSRIFVKVTLPKGSGTPVSASDLINEARRPDNTSLDEKLLKKLAEEGTDNSYVEAGTFTHVAAGDAVMAVDISKDEMQALKFPQRI